MWPMDLLCLILIHTFYKIIRFYDMLFFCESQVILRARVRFPGKLYFLCFYDRLAVVFFPLSDSKQLSSCSNIYSYMYMPMQA